MMIFDLLGLICLILLMFLPFFIARSRKHKQKRAIFWINLLLGWTILIWLPLLIYSLVSDA